MQSSLLRAKSKLVTAETRAWRVTCGSRGTPCTLPSLGKTPREYTQFDPAKCLSWLIVLSHSPSQDSLEKCICKCVSKFSHSSISRPSFHGGIQSNPAVDGKSVLYKSPKLFKWSRETTRCLCLVKMLHSVSVQHTQMAHFINLYHLVRSRIRMGSPGPFSLLG